MARTTHKPAVEWVAPFIRLVGQLHAAVFANVAIHMKVLVHGDYPDCLLGALKEYSIRDAVVPADGRSKRVNFTRAYLNRRDSLPAGRAFGREHSVIIVHAVNLVVNVDCEGNAIETLVAHATPKATWMIRLAHRLQYLWKTVNGIKVQ